MSWTPGPRRRSPRRSPGTGSTTRTCSAASSRWTFDRRRTRSSARGCSRRWCAVTTSSTRCRSPTPRSPGFVFDPDRKKLSKSAGNSPDDPNAVIAEYGSDAVRYWAAGGRPGMDVAFDRNQFKVGRRLAIKLLNASKFVLSFGEPSESATPTEPLDLALLAHLGDVIREATAAFESYDYTRALERTEPFFWAFCDDYVELVKSRAVRGRRVGARHVAHRALGAAPTLRAVPRVRDRRGVVVVARRFGPPRAVAGAVGHRARPRRNRLGPRRVRHCRARCWPRCARRRPRRRSRCEPTSSGRS